MSMTCTDCNNLMRTDGGCWVCPACGFSACDVTGHQRPTVTEEE